MKNTIKRFCFIALVAIIGFSMATLTGCEDNSSSGVPIEGLWELSGTNGYRIQVSGTEGRINNFGSNSLAINAQTKGYVYTGAQVFRNLYRTSDLSWSGQVLLYSHSTGSNICTGVSWNNCTFTVSSDRNTMYTYTPGANTPNSTWYRR